MIIPIEQLNSEILKNIAEDFITRDGTDYGHVELTLNEKVERLLIQVRKQEVLISFDEETESITMIGVDDARQRGLLDSE